MNRLLLVVLLLLLMAFSAGSYADEPPSAVAPVMKILKSGRVPEANLGRILDLVCSKGNEHDLAYVFSEACREEAWPVEVRVSVLANLLAASQNRNLQPIGDLHEITPLLTHSHEPLQQAGIRLAGAWKVELASEPLQKLLSTEKASPATRNVALAALIRMDPIAARKIIDQLLLEETDFSSRAVAIAALTGLDPAAAATKAAQLISESGDRDNPQPVVAPFLDLQGGSEMLAAALEKSPPSPDIAKLALRYMYSVGRSDQQLNEVLSRIAGISQEMPLPNPEELAALVDEIRMHGDPVRGEAVFRRADLSCLKCHAVSKAGGQIGPDLSAVGSSSPVEYLAMAILNPDQAIKEAYTTKVIFTDDGRVFQGIIADQTDETLVLKDTNGHLTTISKSEIEEQVDGKSLMPKGLVKFMTHTEFLDVANFLSQLGKPGPYAIRTTARLQRWQVLRDPAPGLLHEIPNVLLFEDAVLGAKTWGAIYARVNGELPLADCMQPNGPKVVYVSGELDVRKAGPVTILFKPSPGVTLWLDKNALIEAQPTVEIEVGRHRVTLRVDTTVYFTESVLLEFTRPAGASSDFAVVDGQ